MELTPAAFLLFLGVPLLLGHALLRRAGIGPRTDALAYPGWVWMAGALAVSVLEVVRLLAGLPAPGFVVGSALALSTALLLTSSRVAPVVDGELEAALSDWGRLERTFFAAVVALVVFISLWGAGAASLTVVHSYDEASFWSLRAKLLFEAQGFGGTYASAVREAELPNASYPLLNSLLQLWVFDCAGRVTHAANRFPIQLCVLALYLCTAAACRRAGRPWVAGALLLPLVDSAPSRIALGQANADYLVALGALVAADALQRGSRARAPAWAWLGTLAVTFAVWSKKEGTLLLLCALLAWAACAWWTGRWAAVGQTLGRLRTRAAWLVVVPAAVIVGTWVHNLLLQSVGSHAIHSRALVVAWEARADLPLVVSTLLKFGLQRMRGIPVAFALLALLAWPRRPGALAFIPLASLFFVVVLIVRLLPGAEYLLRTAALRVLSQLLPLQALWLAAVATGLLAELRVPWRSRS